MSRSLAFAVAAAALFMTAAPAHAGDGKDLLTFVPENSQMVLVFDVADSRDSALLQKGFQKLIDTNADAKAKLAELGLDPMKDLDTVLFAGGGADGFDVDKVKDVMIIIEGRLPKDKLATIPSAKASTYAGVTIYTNADTDAAFIGDRLFFTKKGKMKGAIDIAQNKGKGKGKNAAVSKKAKALRDAIGTTDTSADFWAAIIVPAKNQKEMKKDQGMIAKTVAVEFNFTADLAMNLEVGTDTADSAAKAVAMVQSQLPQLTSGLSQFGLSKAAKSVMVKQDAATFSISATLTQAELMSLVALAQQFGGGGASPPGTAP
ncbi:MAG TPA: hypothetical protein VM261_38400 [Kofleriaceae bacterium]|nr:hypothetical protein [Kofleriaceae bacterium]